MRNNNKCPARTDVDVVRGIIREEIQHSGKILKYYVIEEIKNRIHPTRLYNKVLSCKRDTGDGSKNLHIGARRVFSDSMRRLKKEFVIDETGFIKPVMPSDIVERAAEPKELGAFSVRCSGNIGQEILGQEGQIIAWTTDAWTAQVICRLLTENEELLLGKGE